MMPTIAIILMGIAAIIQVVFLMRKTEKADPVSHFLLLGGAILLLATTIQRSILINFVAVTNTFESLVFFSGIIALVLFFYRIQKKWKVFQFILFGSTIVAIILLAIASSPIASKEIQPPIPALQSYWLVLHVTFAFIGESFFTVAFIAAIYYLVIKDEEKKLNADRIIYTATAIGYPIYTAGALIFGAIWAEAAWGAFWSWDPKETWALITWLTYTVYLHMRFIKKYKGKVSAIVQIVAFLFTIFTFFGVNFILSGLHSYG
ncbi:MAG: cytochrome c biogenesis protein CcsA [Spirochaetaceae bacterium]|jgi:ABC-type transport system involved in cytochrome c biogenesis permease subunit|nr:cytochrome c biogenesis protein CcsA [Spirochaetaceae bacterium]